jgi:hypothetical protein
MAYPSWHDLQPPLRTTLPKAGGGRIAATVGNPVGDSLEEVQEPAWIGIGIIDGTFCR